MGPNYADFGLATVISRLGLEPEASADAHYVRQYLTQIEVALPGFNLDPSIAHVAAEIAAFDEGLTGERRVALIMLIVASMIALGEGSTRLPVTGPQARAPLTRILGPLCAAPGGTDDPQRTAEMVRSIAEMLDADAVPAVIGRSPEDYRPLLYLTPYIYHQRVRGAEVRLAACVRKLLGGDGALSSARAIAAALADVCDRPPRVGGREIAYSDEQRSAVRNAATHRLAIISGGPGSGKTSIVIAIVRLLVRLGIRPEELALAAPTGKAAQRISESLRDGLGQVREPAAADADLISEGVEAVTMHRLLGYAPGRGIFLHHRHNPLPARVAIVDESSMLDLDLMQRLTAALRPDARLVLLGDADQLPSVAAGAIFRDLVTTLAAGGDGTKGGICARLTQSYRMNQNAESGRAVYLFAQSINRGSIAEAGATPLIRERSTPAEVRYQGVELIDTGRTTIDEFLDHWYGEMLRDRAVEELADTVYDYGESGFDDRSSAELERVRTHRAASRILCATRVLAIGAERINTALHRRAAAAANRPTDGARFLAGEPVMIVRNDYERNLFNGDQGIIAQVRQPDGGVAPMAVFARRGSCMAVHPAALGGALELCYATTIHKAQGSEFENVAVVMPERGHSILTRELLYTAVSRARNSVVLVGGIEEALAAVARKGLRYSGLAELLGGAAAGAQA
jgi:exodeoxyribonuclease V alpha subunit